MKKCFKCQVEKPIECFYKHKAMKDGYLNKCKECTKTDVKNHRNRNIDKIRAYDRARGNRQSKEYIKQYRKRYANKYKAHTAVNNAIRDGRLIKKSCEICGCKAVAHHEDYLKPLDVRWLCQRHHKDWHAKNGPGLNG